MFSLEKRSLDREKQTRDLLSGQHLGLYEDLKANLLNRYGNEGIKVIMFTGCIEGDGVTVTAINLAVLLSRTSTLKVLFLEANFRSPYFYRELSKRHKIESQRGTAKLYSLVDLMAMDCDPFEVANINLSAFTMRGCSGFSIIPSGECYSNPVNIFESPRFNQIMKAMRREFDYIIVDAPPMIGFTETLLLASAVDGVVLVVKSEKTRLQVADKVKKQIGGAGGRILGVVLNQRNHYIPSFIYKYI